MVILYFLPALPFVFRTVLGLSFFRYMDEALAEEENDRATHRAQINALLGFTFLAFIGLSLIDAIVKPEAVNLSQGILFVLTSFIAYFSALQLENWKRKRWEDQLSDALMEAGSLSLLLSVISVLMTGETIPTYGILLTGLGALAWGIDLFVRLGASESNLRERRNEERNFIAATKAAQAGETPGGLG